MKFFGWLFVSYLPFLTSIFPSSYLGNRMFYSFTLLVTGGPLTCWMWTSSKKAIWVDVRDGSSSLSYQDGSWFMPYFHLLTFVNNEQCGEGEMSQYVVFVYVFAFNFALNISPLEVCWAWSTIALPVNTLPLSSFYHYSYLVVFSDFLLF